MKDIVGMISNIGSKSFKKKRVHRSVINPIPHFSHKEYAEYMKSKEYAEYLRCQGNTVNFGRSMATGKPVIQIIEKN